MTPRFDLALLSVFALVAPLPLLAEEDKGNPTARCFPMAEFVPPQPTYVPDVPFTLEFRPVSGDWPTTPSVFGWSIEDDDQFLGQQVEKFSLGTERGDFVQIAAIAQGPGFPGECSVWSTGFRPVTVRRFDATPSPSPTPDSTTPIGSPFPTICTPEPIGSFSPPANALIDDLKELFISFEGEEFLGVTIGLGSTPFPYEEITPNLIRLVDLPPNSRFTWYWAEGFDCRGNPAPHFSFFQTGNGISPTPSGTPTTPTITLSMTPPTPTATNVATSPSMTITPMPAGWILSKREDHPNSHALHPPAPNGNL